MHRGAEKWARVRSNMRSQVLIFQQRARKKFTQTDVNGFNWNDDFWKYIEVVHLHAPYILDTDMQRRLVCLHFF